MYKSKNSTLRDDLHFAWSSRKRKAKLHKLLRKGVRIASTCICAAAPDEAAQSRFHTVRVGANASANSAFSKPRPKQHSLSSRRNLFVSLENGVVSSWNVMMCGAASDA